MSLRTVSIFFAPLLSSCAFVGCHENASELPIPPTSFQNSPTISNRVDTLKFSVNASQFTFSIDQAIEFNGTGVTIEYDISGYGAGRCFVGIRDSVGTLVRVDTLESDTSLISVRPVSFRARFVSILFDSFTGSASIFLRRVHGIPPMLITHFPYRQGAWWQYSVRNLISGTVDTVLVIAVRDTVLNGRLAVFWESTFSSHVEDMHVIRSDDSLWMIDWIPNQFGLCDVIFPLSLGKQWKGNRPFFPTESQVVAFESPGILAIPPVVCYVIDQHWQALPDDEGQIMSWLAPNVGVVKQLKQSFSFPFHRREEWTLIQYHVP